MPSIEVKLKPFRFPNHIKTEIGNQQHRLPVADMTAQQASEYWDAMKCEWLEHHQLQVKAAKDK